MRLLQLLKGDFRFLKRYGILLVYAIFTLVYALIIALVPEAYQKTALTILVYTDPAAMGLFFMGAVILLEKSQRVNCSIAVSPVTVKEYIWSKLLSLMCMGVLASLVIYVLTGFSFTWTDMLCISVSSILFSCCGLIVASKSDSLNLFMIESVPFEMIICIPAILYLFGGCQHFLWSIHPGIMAMKFFLHEINGWNILFGLFVLFVWGAVAFCICRKCVASMFAKLGGGKL